MAKQGEFNDYLSPEGKTIFATLKKHCEKLKMMDADMLELEMLANSFDLYQKSAISCRDEGAVVTIMTKTGPYAMANPAHGVMTREYANILKHSAKFGLNPGDREKIFKGLKEKTQEPDFEE